MARTYKNPTIVSGLSVDQILNMDPDQFNKLSLPEMRHVVGRLVSAGNKRVRNVERAGESTPATRRLMESGGMLSTKGKDLNALKTEYARAKAFLQSRSSTIREWRKIREQTAKELQNKGVDVDVDDLDPVLETYEKLKQIDPNVSSQSMKYVVMKEISNLSDELDLQERVDYMVGRLQELYEEQEELNNEFEGVSGFFE